MLYLKVSSRAILITCHFHFTESDVTQSRGNAHLPVPLAALNFMSIWIYQLSDIKKENRVESFSFIFGKGFFFFPQMFILKEKWWGGGVVGGGEREGDGIPKQAWLC